MFHMVKLLVALYAVWQPAVARLVWRECSVFSRGTKCFHTRGNPTKHRKKIFVHHFHSSWRTYIATSCSTLHWNCFLLICTTQHWALIWSRHYLQLTYITGMY